ncbi:hypothetical protein LX69_01583 [Breznakibacter xylanolyticus]|uniref:Uncharacterized protein n=1 Tax=Breznakibacter xylanolyticus TaxID=990 RepID=A0A2W7NAY0_9BACT|nr:hypothetical protein [Breznakibacter xylanolyticus]PZX17268.1 hypothetical protein LX69_01583 [Breznakibacter xylanolyticus]
MNNIPKIKKRYTKPELVAVAIDQEIALIMMTTPPGHPGGPLLSSPAPSASAADAVFSSEVEAFSKEEDVFGSSSGPSY